MPNIPYPGIPYPVLPPPTVIHPYLGSLVIYKVLLARLGMEHGPIYDTSSTI